MSTLLCCALPVTLVSIGMGATFASLTASFPQLIWLVERKDALFIVTGLTLVVSFFLLNQSQTKECPVEPNQREICQKTRAYNQPIYWITVVIYIVGLSFSYIVPRIMYE